MNDLSLSATELFFIHFKCSFIFERAKGSSIPIGNIQIEFFTLPIVINYIFFVKFHVI